MKKKLDEELLASSNSLTKLRYLVERTRVALLYSVFGPGDVFGRMPGMSLLIQHPHFVLFM